MDFFICCFRSCLRGKDAEKNNKEYYFLLGLNDTSCSQEDIKKAYKRTSLQLHPDKIAQRGAKATPEDSLKFQKVKEAFEVLSDTSRRRYYDEFGENGLKLMESTKDGNVLELLKNFQDNKLDCILLSFMILFFFIFVLALPILFCLRADETITTPWSIIWVPMWFVDALLLIIAILALFFTFHQEIDPEDKESNLVLSKLYFFFKVSLFVLSQLFVILKLDAYISWSWLVVLIPVFLFEIMTIAASIPVAYNNITKPNYDNLASSLLEDPDELKIFKLTMDAEYHEKILKKLSAIRYIVVSILICVLVLLIGVKLDKINDMSWGLVFVPVWIYFIFIILDGNHIISMGKKMLSNIDQNKQAVDMDPIQFAELQRGYALIAAGRSEMCFLWLPISIAILVVCKLEFGNYSYFIVLIPLFIIIGYFIFHVYFHVYSYHLIYVFIYS